MSDRPTCKTCRHWKPFLYGSEPEGFVPTDGECRIRAPIHIDDFGLAKWARVDCNAGCAEHVDAKAHAEHMKAWEDLLKKTVR